MYSASSRAAGSNSDDQKILIDDDAASLGSLSLSVSAAGESIV